MSMTAEVTPASVKGRLEAHKIHFYYGSKQALRDVTLTCEPQRITALIGPSGCGKSTFLRCLNRMNDLIEGTRFEGNVTLDKIEIYGPDVDVVELRKVVGMVFQKPNPFPMSIFDNIAYGPRIHGTHNGQDLKDHVEKCLRAAFLWEEVKDDLTKKSGAELSGGQQQRLCIARTISVNPEVILMDEPCSALDPISTAKIEELMADLKKHYTIIIVTHNMQQAQRVSDVTAFFDVGHIVEQGATLELFTRPKQKRTEDYISGRFG